MRSIVEILADNLCSNMETVAQNRAARELSELTDEELRKVGVSRDKLEQGSDAYPWTMSDNESQDVDLEALQVQIRQLKPKSLFGFLA